MEHSHLSEHLQDADNFKRFHQEGLLLNVASLIYTTMKKKGISRSQLAELLGISRSRVTQYLGGENNLRLRTVANIFTAMGYEFHASAGEISKTGWIIEEKSEMIQFRPRLQVPKECFKHEPHSHQLAG